MRNVRRTKKSFPGSAKEVLTEAPDHRKCVDALMMKIDPHLADVVQEVWLVKKHPNLEASPLILRFTQRLTGKKDGSLGRIDIGPEIPPAELFELIVSRAQDRGLMGPDQLGQVSLHETDQPLWRLRAVNKADIPDYAPPPSALSAEEEAMVGKAEGKHGKAMNPTPGGSQMRLSPAEKKLVDAIADKVEPYLVDVIHGPSITQTDPDSEDSPVVLEFRQFWTGDRDGSIKEFDIGPTKVALNVVVEIFRRAKERGLLPSNRIDILY